MLVLLVACVRPTESDEVDSASTTDTWSEGDNRQVWDSSGFTLNEPDVGGRWLGWAQTGSVAGWGGEDCLAAVPSWYSSTVDDQGYQLCHPIPADGGLRLTTVDSPDQVRAGETTLFTQSESDELTYVFFATDLSTCWTWGDDPSYYASFDCSHL